MEAAEAKAKADYRAARAPYHDPLRKAEMERNAAWEKSVDVWEDAMAKAKEDYCAAVAPFEEAVRKAEAELEEAEEEGVK
jgi:hypothetical protein